MKVVLRSLSIFVLATLALGVTAEAATLKGKVVNGTTLKPAPYVEVVLIQLQGGMQPVANSKTNANGEFTFDHPGIGAQPMLVRAVYKGVNFHQSLPPGRDSVDISVYDLSSDAKTISVPSHLVIFQPNGDKLTVAEQMLVRNESKPPVAYFRADGNFRVALPDKAELRQIAASGPSGMPVTQVPIDLGKNKYAIAFAFRPGDNEVRIAYEMPYTGNAATLKLAPSYGESRVILVVPPSVTLTGDQLQSAGQEQGMNLFEHTFAAGTSTYTVSLSGTAPTPQESAARGSDAQGANGRLGGEEQGTPIQVVPGRLNVFSLPGLAILGILVIGFIACGVLLWMKPVVVPEQGAAAIQTSSTPKSSPTPAKASATIAEPTSLVALDKEAATSLDGLKDLIFKLELRRQAGTISETEYAAERARAEQILRDLVRG